MCIRDRDIPVFTSNRFNHLVFLHLFFYYYLFSDALLDVGGWDVVGVPQLVNIWFIVDHPLADFGHINWFLDLLHNWNVLNYWLE